MAKWTCGKKIGSGSFGEVFEAVSEDGTAGALKRLLRNVPVEERLRFAREVRIQTPLQHRNIVPILAHNLSEEPPFFVMPRAACSLRQRLREVEHGPAQVWTVEHVALGLIHAHRNGIIHRDLKPENILFFPTAEDDQVLFAAIADFGLGRHASTETMALTGSDVSMGTVEYVSPEQYRDAKRADHRADIYSLGKILYEVLTGEVPHPEMDLEKVPNRYRYIVQRACARDLERRYSTVQELLDGLRSVAQADVIYAKPAAAVRTLIQQLMTAEQQEPEQIARLVRLLDENLEDIEVLMNILPSLPSLLLERVLTLERQGMKSILNFYDESVSGGLPFEYCDTVAGFYKTLFAHTKDHEIRTMILRRLPLLGTEHNRWHVGKVFGNLVASIEDPSLVMAVRDVLVSDAKVGEWCAPYLRGQALPQALRQVLKEPS